LYLYSVETTHEPYFYPESQLVNRTSEVTYQKSWRTEAELSTRRLILHTALLLMSVITVTLTGAASIMFEEMPDSWVFLLKSPVVTTSALIRETAAGHYWPLIG